MSDIQAPPAIPPAAPALPLLCGAPEPLAPGRHGGLRVREAGYGFAAAATAIPLAAGEFPAAARTLPIVFAAEAPHLPVALTGLTAGTNLFVEPDGTWRAGAYVPAYLRRIPFFLLPDAADPGRLVPCIDTAAPQVSEAEGEPLFDAAGAPTPPLERALAFTRSLEEGLQGSRALTARLLELGLLRPAVVQFPHQGGPMRVDGFFAVDRPALAALPAAQLAGLRDSGWLEAIYAHLLSIGCLPELARDIDAPG